MTNRHSRPARLASALILLALLALLLPVTVSAQQSETAGLTADQVLEKLRESADRTQDASFVLYGTLLAEDGTQHRIEVETEILPALNLARLYILQPDALADNFIILAEDATYSYNYLTNQVIIYAPGDPAAFGPLAGDSAADPAAADGGSFRLTLDVDELFSGWEVELAGHTESAEGPAYVLDFLNADPEAAIGTASVTVPESSWLPRAISVFSRDGSLLAELEILDLETDSGLTAAELLWLPPDAEVIDERR
jgi:outer membrane lipoprotein-sorting protein